MFLKEPTCYWDGSDSDQSVKGTSQDNPIANWCRRQLHIWIQVENPNASAKSSVRLILSPDPQDLLGDYKDALGREEVIFL